MSGKFEASAKYNLKEAEYSPRGDVIGVKEGIPVVLAVGNTILFNTASISLVGNFINTRDA